MTGLSDLKGTYALDANHSQIGFIARHAVVTKVRGMFKEVTGTATIDGANPSNSSLSVEIQAGSVDSRSEMRDGHMKGEDFFDVEKYPTITFVATGFEITDAETVKVTGDLTIKGVSHPVTVPFTYLGTNGDPWGNERVGFEGSVVVNRKDWGLNWNAPIETGGLLVSENITLEFEVAAVKQADAPAAA